MKRTVVSSVSLTCLTAICPFQSQSSIIPLLYYVFSFPPPAFSWTISTDSYCFICLGWLHWNPKGDLNLQAESERVSEIITYSHHLVVTRLPQPTRTHNTYEYLNRKQVSWRMGGRRGDLRPHTATFKATRKCNSLYTILIERKYDSIT